MAALVPSPLIYATMCSPTSRFSRLQSGRFLSRGERDGSAGRASDREADAIPGNAYSKERSVVGGHARETYEYFSIL